MKREYICPCLIVQNVYSKYGVLDSIVIGSGTVDSSDDIGFAKEQDFDDEEIGNGSSVWED